jgi:serine protease inhibitor
MKTIALVILMIMLTFSCERNSIESDIIDDVPKDTVTIDVIEKTASVTESDIIFGFNLLREILKNDQSANTLISPASVALALAMTYNGANGETKSAFEATLRKQGYTLEELNDSYKSMINSLKSIDPKVLTQISSSIWYDDNENFTVIPDFININQEYYDADVTELNFGNPEALNRINGWVNDETHGRIEKIIDSMDPDALMYLINAIYFKGAWKHEFDSSKTFKQTFHTSRTANISTDFMKLSDSLKMLETSKFEIAELPYGQGNFSMMILLPHFSYSTSDIMDSLTVVKWNSWIAEMSLREVHLTLPKFKFSYNNELKNELSNLGLGTAFSDQADFSGINGIGGLKISRVIHKSFIEVNEEGTEAAAVTGIEIVPTSDGPSGPYYFNADRPFLFAIRQNTTGAIIFLGRVQDPTMEENGE